MKKLLPLLFIIAVGVGMAQNASISGLITDSSQALVPNAKVTITNQDTGAKRTTESNEQGYYAVSALTTGRWRIVVSAPGFQLIDRSGVTLEVAQQLRLDFTLEPGTTQQTIEVHADVVALNNEQAEFATTLNETAVKELPLEVGGLTGQALRRQIDDFIFLVPGATGTGFVHRFNGGTDMSNEVFYNGVPYVFPETQGWQENTNPPYESVNEFKVLTTVFSAQYGHGQGVVSYNFASGTNALHGNLFEFVRNDVFDARSFFSPVVSLNRQNEYGFTVGAPLFIPKLYNGKKYKTFFNTSVAWFKYRGAPLTGLNTVPTMAMRQGDFSGLVDPSGNQIPIYDPTNRLPFPGNQIPSSRFSNVAKGIIPLIPQPAYPGVVNNIGNGVTSLPVDDTTWSFRVDQYLGDRQQISFTMWRDTNAKTALFGSNLSGPLGGYGDVPESVLGSVLNYTQTIRPNLVMTAGMSWNGWINSQYPAGKDNTVDIPGVPKGAVFPGYNFSGPFAAPVELGTGYTGAENRKLGISLVNNFAWVKGKHSLSLGYEVRRPYQNNSANNPYVFTFSNRTTSLPESPNFSNYGHPFASFLLGLADSALFNAPSIVEPRSWYAAGYLQDDFKVTRKLTLNLGARYDFFIPFTERYNNITFFNPDIPNPAAGGIPGALMKAGDCVGCAGRDRIADIRTKYIAPRIGIAYALDKKTVIRGGYGIVYLNGGASEFGTNKVVTGFSNGLSAQAAFVSPDAGVTPGYGSIDNPMPVLTRPTFSPSAGNGQNINYLARYHGQVPYVQSWMVGVQRELPGAILLSAAYVGNHAVHLPSELENLDQVDPKYLSLGNVLLADINSPQAEAAGIGLPYPGFTGSVAQALRPYPQYLSITSNFDESSASTYNAFQLSLQKRISHGLQFLISYTAARNMSNTSSGFSTFNTLPINTYNRKAEWSTDPNDVPHSLAMSGIYELPIGPGKKLLSAKSPASHILGGWQAGWVLRYSSGIPVGFSASNVMPVYNIGTNGETGNRPNVVSGVSPCLSKSGFDPARNLMFNAAAFSQPADYTFGNAPRVENNCFGFPYYNEDANLVKYFKFTEMVHLEFRAEFFNVFNRVQFGTASSFFSPTNSNFGVVTGQANSPRGGQLGLKLTF